MTDFSELAGRGLLDMYSSQEATEKLMGELYQALTAVLPWAGKAVAEHPYNTQLGGRAIDKANAALDAYKARDTPSPSPSNVYERKRIAGYPYQATGIEYGWMPVSLLTLQSWFGGVSEQVNLIIAYMERGKFYDGVYLWRLQPEQDPLQPSLDGL